jgi:hypothetical protein
MYRAVERRVGGLDETPFDLDFTLRKIAQRQHLADITLSTVPIGSRTHVTCRIKNYSAERTRWASSRDDCLRSCGEGKGRINGQLHTHQIWSLVVIVVGERIAILCRCLGFYNHELVFITKSQPQDPHAEFIDERKLQSRISWASFGARSAGNHFQYSCGKE